MSDAFTPKERAYLSNGPRLAHVATVDHSGAPHVVPTGWTYDDATGTIVVRGHQLDQTKKYRDAAATGRIALVVDHIDEPWQPVGIEIRGRAEAVGTPDAHIRIYPTRVISWGIESDKIGERFARNVSEEMTSRSEEPRDTRPLPRSRASKPSRGR